MTGGVAGRTLGRTETRQVVLFDEDDPLRLAGGRTLAPVEVAYETYGTLAPDRGNAVFLCHALTGDAHAAGHGDDAGRPGWWDTLVGPGKPVDTDRFYVVCPNLLGGCRGTTGPSSPDPATGRPYGLRFPPLAMSDFVTVHRRLCAHLGIERLHAAVGGSLGGMQIIQWLLDAPGEVERAVLVCATAQLSAQNIAFSAVARDAITTDPSFRGGDYVNDGRAPGIGLATARKLAHITYLSEASMERKFGRARRAGRDGDRLGTAAEWLDTAFEVESYLDHQAETFLARFDALTYLYLTRVMDFFDPFADAARTRTALAAAPGARQLVISFDTDWRFATDHSARIVRDLRAAGARDVTFREIASPWGHDSFLLDVPAYHDAVRAFLADAPVAGEEPAAAAAGRPRDGQPARRPGGGS